MSETPDEKVLLRREGAVAYLTINRPAVRNALDGETIRTLTTRFQELAGEVKGVVLRGAGTAFCAGADLKEMKDAVGFSAEENLADARQLAGLFHAVRDFPGVVLVVVQGAAFGGALGLVAAADAVLASTAARFCLSEVRIGIVPAVISPFLIDRMGEGNCRAPVLLGYKFDAREAQRRGLVDKVVEPDELEDSLRGLVDQHLSKCAPGAVREAKALLRRVRERTVDDVFEDTAQTIAKIRVGAEAQEGFAAFLEKRPPAWVAAATDEGESS